MIAGTGCEIGPYTLIKKLGSGAYGVVWLAERRTSITTTRVAVKTPLCDDFDIDVIKQEANLWVEASGHPNILPIIEANIYQEQIIIVSEYAPDGSLSSWLKKNSDIHLETAVEITSGILAGLEHLHSKNIVHRDLKPDNILLQGEIPRLADFGIAQVLRSNTQSSMVVGTPAYMPPEAFFGNHNLQGDLWATAVIFYRLLTGKLPFSQTSLPLLVGSILESQFDPLPQRIPAVICEFVTKALQKKPEERYQSASEMRKALKQAYKKSLNLQKSFVASSDTSSFSYPLEKTRPLYASLPSSLSKNLSVDDSFDNSSDEFLFPDQDFDNFDNKENKNNITSFSLPAMITLQTNSLEKISTFLTPTKTEKTLKIIEEGSEETDKTLSDTQTKIIQPFLLPKFNHKNFSSLFSHLFSSGKSGVGSFKTPSKQTYLTFFLLVLIGLCLLQKSFFIEIYNSFSVSALKLNTISLLHNLSLNTTNSTLPIVENNSSETLVLVGVALNEVNCMLFRVETEFPPDDPAKTANLMRFNSFRDGLENYYTGNLTAEEARQYAESALSQTKSLQLQLNEKKKNTLTPVVCKVKKKSKILLNKKICQNSY